MSGVSRLRVVVIACFAASLVGCTMRPRDVLIPTTAAVVGSSRVDMLVVTTRARSDTPGQIYSGERSDLPSVANVVISIPPEFARKVGEVQWPNQLPANPNTDFTTIKIDQLGPGEGRKWYKKVASVQRKVLIFVHGYNSNFEDAVYRFAQIVHDSGADAAPILFTWPSRGKLLAYAYDRESATLSRTALETLLTEAATDPNVSEVTVMAHSMGNWVLTEALRQMAIRNRRILPKIKNVIMAAPDLDVDVFRAQILDMPEPRPLFTLFSSKDDKALNLSNTIAGGSDRLGAIDPEAEPYRTKLANAKIQAIDLTKLKAGDSLNHGKFASSPAIVQFIGQRLVNGQEISDGEATIPAAPLLSVTAETIPARLFSNAANGN